MNSNKKSADFTWGEITLFAAGCAAGTLAGVWGVSRLVSAMQAQAPGFWFVSRAAGIVAYVLLWASTSWGIVLSSKGIAGLSAPLAYALHNITSWLVIGFGVAHALALLGDRVVPFAVGGMFVPFTADYQTVLTGVGTLSLYVAILVSVSFYWKKQIGFKAWRAIHLLAYLMFVGVTVHGVLLGTDTTTTLMKWTYILAGGSVLFLTLFRALTAGGKKEQAAAERVAA